MQFSRSKQHACHSLLVMEKTGKEKQLENHKAKRSIYEHYNIIAIKSLNRWNSIIL